MDALAPPPPSMGLYPQATSPTASNNVVVFEKTINVDEDVALFFDTRFASRQDLTHVRKTLKEQTAASHELSKKLDQSQQAAAKVLQDSQATSKTLLDGLRRLESSVLDMEEQMETSETFLTAKGNFGQRSVLDDLTELRAKVQALEDAKKYILLLATAQRLVSESRQNLGASAEKALGPYGSLVELSKKIKEITAGNQTNLDAYVSASANSLLQEFKTRLSKKFQLALDAIGWPKPIPQPATIPEEKQQELQRAFRELLLLQRPTFGDLDRTVDRQYPPLLPLEILVAPLILRFRFHFEGKRPTNRIDKPEWYLTHIQGLIKEHSAFLQDFMQGILDGTEYQDYDVKIRASVPQMLETPELLSHAIHETIKFDTKLREEEYYVPPGQIHEWQGCVQVYLGKKAWLMAWLQVERDFAVARYTSIIEEPGAWDPAYDDLGKSEYIIPTKSAEKVKDLLDIITDRYRPLSVLEQRTFLLDIQLDILNIYYRHIRGLIDQYESMAYSFVRNLPGAASQIEIDTTGIDGLRKLCRWMSSVEYIKTSLKEWSDDVFFLELQRDIKNSAVKTNPTASTGSGMQVSGEEIAKELSVDGSLFDDAIKAYDRLSVRIQELIVRQVTKEVFAHLKAYLSLRSWPQIEMSTPDELARLQSQNSSSPRHPYEGLGGGIKESDDVSPELYIPLSMLTHSLTFLAESLPLRYFTTIYRQLSLDIQEHLWTRLIFKNQFSELGGRQFARDIWQGIFGCGRRWIKKPENYHRKLRDASILLSLQSAKANSPQPQPPSLQSMAQDPWAPHVKHSLAQMMAVLFDEDQELALIQKKLEDIGVTHLSVQEAREVVRQRVECWR
ncbi:hypothetical protein DFQ26_001605 [Actinomortierella ambigua]|nr:hypothetical protein DFQ26_001605 [Actinomortierella ambigua]